MRNSYTSEGLLGLQVFTGVDSTSAFVGKGKKKAFSLFHNNPQIQKSFQCLGSQFTITDSLTENMERFVCKLYGQPGNDINEARHSIFCSRALSEVNLPPCRNALVQHIKRANYQAAIWRRALKADIHAPSPHDNDWIIAANNQVLVRWMSQEQAPQELLKNYSCNCKKSECSNNQCSCFKSEVSCTDLCSCIICKNDCDTVIKLELLNDVSDDEESDEC